MALRMSAICCCALLLSLSSAAVQSPAAAALPTDHPSTGDHHHKSVMPLLNLLTYLRPQREPLDLEMMPTSYLTKEAANFRKLQDFLNGRAVEESGSVKKKMPRALRQTQTESAAPKMYARHIGELGGTMFRFG